MNAGDKVRAVRSAEQAIEMVRAAHWIPQFTLVDVHLPGMNGIDLAIVLKGECPGCQVSLFSGQTSTSDLLEAASKIGHLFEVATRPVRPTGLFRFSLGATHHLQAN